MQAYPRYIERRKKLLTYYVNKNAQSNGDHEVHRADCYRLPDAENRIYLGNFYTAQAAVRAAREYFDHVDGCYYCCNEAHHH